MGEPERASEAIEGRARSIADFDLLSKRERDVLKLLTKGLNRAEVASELFRSPKTIDKHCSRIYNKLGVHSQAQLIALVSQHSGIDLGASIEPSAVNDAAKLEDRVARAALAVERRILPFPQDQYFRRLVRAMSDQLDVPLAGISEFDIADQEIVILVATDRGQPLSQHVCPMVESACGTTYRLGECVCERDAKTAFPDSEAFRLANVDAYAGVRLENSATGAIGCLWVADRRPFADIAFILDVLRVLRYRVSSELALQIAIDRVEELGGMMEAHVPLACDN